MIVTERELDIYLDYPYEIKLPEVRIPTSIREVYFKISHKVIEYYIDNELAYKVIGGCHGKYIPISEECKKLTKDQASELFFFHRNMKRKWKDIPEITKDNQDIWNYYLQHRKSSDEVINLYPFEIELLKKDYMIVPGALNVYHPSRSYRHRDKSHFISFGRMVGGGLYISINNFTSRDSIDPVKLTEKFKLMNSGEITIRDILRDEVRRLKEWFFALPYQFTMSKGELKLVPTDQIPEDATITSSILTEAHEYLLHL